jgi:hypothetical protein
MAYAARSVHATPSPAHGPPATAKPTAAKPPGALTNRLTRLGLIWRLTRIRTNAGVVSDRHDVGAKLATVDQWVHDEFGYVSELMTALDCVVNDESGPGRSYRLHGRAAVRVHPKQSHLALGFPPALRDDVAALTGALRPQRDAAWFNYAPGVGDRDTVEALIDKSTRSIAAGYLAGATPSANDAADLQLILSLLRAFKEHETTTGTPGSVRVLREAIFFRWEAPRLPPGGKYSPRLPHSPAARARRQAGRTDGLVFEHVMPISLVIKRLLADLPADTTALRAVLDTTADRVIITKAEDQALVAAGTRTRLPTLDDPWSRYRAAGLDPATFAPFSA